MRIEATKKTIKLVLSFIKRWIVFLVTRISKQRYTEIFAALIVVVFIYAAGSKLADFDYFKWQMHAQKFSAQVAEVVIYTLPSIEIAVSLMLIFQPSRNLGFLASTLLMLVFTLYMGLVHFGYYQDVPCACGGILQDMGFGVHFYFNLTFLIVAGIGSLLSNHLRKGGLTGQTA